MKDLSYGFFFGLFLTIALLLFGNFVGDQKTIRDCATTGQAKMFGGGSVTCEVVKEKP